MKEESDPDSEGGGGGYTLAKRFRPVLSPRWASLSPEMDHLICSSVDGDIAKITFAHLENPPTTYRYNNNMSQVGQVAPPVDRVSIYLLDRAVLDVCPLGSGTHLSPLMTLLRLLQAEADEEPSE
eukprot:7067396-Pyramimonas_sp.AAC.1